MKRKLFVAGLLTIALILMVSVYPVLTKPGESKGKQKTQYNVDFTGDIETIDADLATVVNQWGMGIYGMYRISLTFLGSELWNGFEGEHQNGELGLHTKDKGSTVRMNFAFKLDEGDRHAHVLEATGTVVNWMGDSFSIVFDNTEATIWYKKSAEWTGQLTFTIALDILEV
jgi:hypothetical protein